MKLENVIVERPYKKVYRCEEGIAKVFEPTHPKEDVFNEALNQARVEATGLNIPKVKSVNDIDGKWALVIEYKEGKTLEELMTEHPEKWMSTWSNSWICSLRSTVRQPRY